jgi:hypothetical protein
MVHRRTSVALFCLFLAFTPIALFLVPDLPSELIPELWVFALWALPLALFAHVRSVYNRIIGFAWILWPLVGSLNVIASYQFYGDFYLVDATPAALIYLAFTTVCLLGIIAYERSHPEPAHEISAGPDDDMNPWMTNLMIVFPFVWFASVYKTLGYIPVLLGTDITEDMYEISYGPLYGLSLLLVISMLVALELSRAAKTTRAKWIYRGLVAFFGACSMIDSKRVTLMLFMVCLFAYLIRTRGARKMRTGVALLVIAATIGLYIAGQVIRTGADSEFYANSAIQLSTVGVEYRDFVYSVNNFHAGEIPNYDWALSAVGSMVNSTVLDAAGIDKQKLVEMGSAYAWKNLLGSDFGIRTGIVSELYFGYGYAGLLIVFAFGWVSAWISAKIAFARTKFGLIFTCVIYALLLLSIVGQTMSTTGGLTVLLYAWVLHVVLRHVSAPVVAPEQKLVENEHARNE